ncbi:MAG TPA: Ppx/GppA phosphatase family protein [Microthrixaceae bacterium]|nr:Ppx/GppA phosphatase family protein [Microthrixaceae bacterium]
MSPRYAAIDCGTNSTRLLIGDGVATDERLMRITRLGAGVDGTGRLAPDAIERVLACLRDFRAVMDRHELAGVRMTATSAARDAANRDDFFGPATEIIGTAPELLTGREEGELSFRGATAELDVNDGPFLVVDIGGGSTELSYGTTECEATTSLDVGCVRMAEQFLHSDPPAPEELAACIQVLQLHMDDVRRELPMVADARRLIGLAGTVSAVAAIEQGLAEYDRARIHHFELTKAAAEDVFRTLATEALADRLHNPGLEPDRADVIVGGCCVLVSVLREFGFASCLVSESDILDGLVLSQGGRATAERRATEAQRRATEAQRRATEGTPP